MEDIRLAVALIAFVSVAVFMATIRLLKGRSRTFLTLMAAIVVGLVLIYVFTVWGQLWIVKWIPLPSVIILSNWFPPLMAALAAIVWLQMGKQTVARRMPIMIVMAAAAAGSLLWFIPKEPPECGDIWVTSRFMPWRVYKQTTPFTCSAAAAATILGTIDIETSEQEMAKLCLTKSGTTWLGLYHGLSTRLLQSNSKHRVEFFECDVTRLEEMASEHPILLCCELEPQFAKLKPSLVSEGGWRPGTAHTVVYFGKFRRGHLIGDPTRGYEMWPTEDLNLLWTGQGLKLSHIKAVPSGE